MGWVVVLDSDRATRHRFQAAVTAGTRSTATVAGCGLFAQIRVEEVRHHSVGFDRFGEFWVVPEGVGQAFEDNETRV